MPNSIAHEHNLQVSRLSLQVHKHLSNTTLTVHLITESAR